MQPRCTFQITCSEESAQFGPDGMVHHFNALTDQPDKRPCRGKNRDRGGAHRLMHDEKLTLQDDGMAQWEGLIDGTFFQQR